MDIHTRTGTKASHSFDVWGTLIDKTKMGMATLELYQTIAEDEGHDPAAVAQAVQDYMSLIAGSPAATDKSKAEKIAAVYDHIQGRTDQLDESQALYSDVIPTIAAIQDAGEEVIIFGTKDPQLMQRALPKDLGDRLRLYETPVKTAEAFGRVYAQEQAAGAHMIGHTGDERAELEGARESGLFLPEKVIYIHRGPIDQSIVEDGFRHTDSLEKICYHN